MYKDVIDLRDFYGTPLGHTAQRIVRRYIRSVWPDVKGLSVAGIGYPIPYLRPIMDAAARVVARASRAGAGDGRRFFYL